jgi:DNA polymerase III subunit alpha
VGEGPIRAICAAREQDGPFQSLEDMCERLDRKEVGKRVYEALIKCGALDDLPGSRRQKLAAVDTAMAAAADAQRLRESGQVTMFDDMFGSAVTTAGGGRASYPPINEGPAEQKEQLAWEKELLGIYISEHPVAQALASLPEDPQRLTLGMISEAHVGQKIELMGMLSGLRKLQTKKGDTMLTAQLEDLEGSVEMVVFPKAYEKFSEFWVEDNVVAVGGKIETRRDSLQLVCEHVAPYTSIGSNGGARNSTSAPLNTANDFAFVDMAGLGFEEDGYEEAPPDDLKWEGLATVPPPAAQTVGTHVPAPSSNGQAAQSGGYASTNGAAANGSTNGYASTNGHADNGAHAPEPHADVVPQSTTTDDTAVPAEEPTPVTPQAAPATVMRPRQRIQIARKDDDVRPVAPTPSGPSYHLHITLCRSENADADIRCMQEVYKVLQRFDGGHQVSLYLPTGDCNVILQPMKRVNPTPELLASLKEILGETQVVLEGA